MKANMLQIGPELEEAARVLRRRSRRTHFITTHKDKTALFAAHILRQMRRDLPPLFVAQPKQVAAHSPCSKSQRQRINNRFSPQCFYWVLALDQRAAVYEIVNNRTSMPVALLADGARFDQRDLPVAHMRSHGHPCGRVSPSSPTWPRGSLDCPRDRKCGNRRNSGRPARQQSWGSILPPSLSHRAKARTRRLSFVEIFDSLPVMRHLTDIQCP